MMQIPKGRPLPKAIFFECWEPFIPSLFGQYSGKFKFLSFRLFWVTEKWAFGRGRLWEVGFWKVVQDASPLEEGGHDAGRVGHEVLEEQDGVEVGAVAEVAREGGRVVVRHALLGGLGPLDTMPTPHGDH